MRYVIIFCLIYSNYTTSPFLSPACLAPPLLDKQCPKALVYSPYLRTVFISGASRGLGAIIAKTFASNNYNIIINYNKSEHEAINLKKDLESKYNIKCYLYKCDVSDELKVKEMFLKIKDEIGNIECVINNAGISLDNSLTDKTSDEFMKVISVNLLGTYLISKYSLKVLKKGCIINVASNNVYVGSYIESIDYDASKAGVISLTHSLARFLAPNIRVNAVAPGWILTDMTKDLDLNFKKCEEDKILLKRFAEPEEIADAVYFLASNEYVNDCILRIDGGIK